MISPDVLSWSSDLLHGTTRLPRPRPRSREHLSGVLRPFSAHRRRESTSRPFPSGSSRAPAARESDGIAPTIPKPSATVSLAGFLNPSATCSSLHRPAIFRRVALLGLRPPGIHSPHEAPPTRHRRRALLAFLPRLARSCRRSHPPWARRPLPRILGTAPLLAFRAFVLVRIDPHRCRR